MTVNQLLNNASSYELGEWIALKTLEAEEEAERKYKEDLARKAEGLRGKGR